MDEVSIETVRETIIAKGIRSWRLRTCSICDAPLHYLFSGDEVAYQSGCDCSWSPPLPSSYASVAGTLNMQTPEIRARMWRELTTSPD